MRCRHEPRPQEPGTALGLVWDCHRTPDGFYGLPAPLERRTRCELERGSPRSERSERSYAVYERCNQNAAAEEVHMAGKSDAAPGGWGVCLGCQSGLVAVPKYAILQSIFKSHAEALGSARVSVGAH